VRNAPERNLGEIFAKAAQAVLEVKLPESDDDELAAVRDVEQRVCEQTKYIVQQTKE
jgi:hypothetical protein